MRAHSSVKIALAIIMGASKYIKLLPKLDDDGEIITANIDDFFTTTEEFTEGKDAYKNNWWNEPVSCEDLCIIKILCNNND